MRAIRVGFNFFSSPSFGAMRDKTLDMAEVIVDYRITSSHELLLKNIGCAGENRLSDVTNFAEPILAV